LVLKARDELRHPPSDDPLWRESIYWNFNDEANRIGAWIYFWVSPKQPQPTGMIVSFYHGQWADPTVFERAMASPNHTLVEGDRWIYCFQKNDRELLKADFDDIEFHGMKFRREEELSRYRLSLSDDAGNGFDFETGFLMPPFDYADGVNETPPWLATNRYHRNHVIRGELRIAGKTFRIDCTGDSDHSWGTRDWSIMGTHMFKMWSFQTPDGRLAASFFDQGLDVGKVALGSVRLDGKLASAKWINSKASYDANGLQRDIHVEILDDLGRKLNAFAPSMHSCIGWRVGPKNDFWGYEGVGTFQIEGFGKVAGATSFFWPSTITAADLHSGNY
jgi:hypothetical protein